MDRLRTLCIVIFFFALCFETSWIINLEHIQAVEKAQQLQSKRHTLRILQEQLPSREVFYRMFDMQHCLQSGGGLYSGTLNPFRKDNPVYIYGYARDAFPYARGTLKHSLDALIRLIQFPAGAAELVFSGPERQGSTKEICDAAEQRWKEYAISLRTDINDDLIEILGTR